MAFRRQLLGHLELAGQNFLVELGSVFVFEGQVASDHGKKDDATGPHVDARSKVGLALDHLRRGVAGTSAGRLEGVALLVSVGKAEVDQLEVVFVV